jgi:hypothetical protein
MKKNVSLFPVLSLVLFILAAACSKGDSGGGTTPPPPTEENLRISTNAGSLNVLPGAEFDFNVVVESKMPADGVKIEYTVRGESDNVNYPQGPAIETKSASTAIRISGLPRQKFCVATVTVTSKSKPSNTANTNFRVVYK